MHCTGGQTTGSPYLENLLIIMIITIQSRFLFLIQELQDFSNGAAIFCPKSWCIHTPPHMHIQIYL